MSLILYSREACHLCHDMRRAITALAPAAEVDIVDIDDDPVLKRRYGLRIPVLKLDDEILCEGQFDRERVSEALLR